MQADINSLGEIPDSQVSNLQLWRAKAGLHVQGLWSPWTETAVPAWFLPAGWSVQAVIVTSRRKSNGGHLSVGQTVEANKGVFGNCPSSQPVK